MSYGTLALIVAIGLLGPALALLPTRVAPPVVIGEIAAGIAFGHTGTHTIDATQPTLAFLADIGFALLMFIVATNLPLRDARIRGAARRGLLATALTVAGAIALSPALAALTGLHRPAVLAVLIASSSAAIVLPILGTRDRDEALLVTIALVSFADVATVLAVPFVLSSGSFGRALAGALLIVAGATAVGLVGRRLVGLEPVEALRDESHHMAWALDLRLSLLVLFALAWIAERFDTSALLAGFAAGVMVSLLGEPRRVADQLIGLGEGFFVPLFFVVLGAKLDLRAVVQKPSILELTGLLVAANVVVHAFAAALTRQTPGAALAATAQLGLPAGVVTLGLAHHLISPAQGGAVLLAALVTIGLCPAGIELLVRADPAGSG